VGFLRGLDGVCPIRLRDLSSDTNPTYLVYKNHRVICGYRDSRSKFLTRLSMGNFLLKYKSCGDEKREYIVYAMRWLEFLGVLKLKLHVFFGGRIQKVLPFNYNK
jgi:hypothetical protein